MAELGSADLRGANLRGAYCMNVGLMFTRLDGVDLSATHYLPHVYRRAYQRRNRHHKNDNLATITPKAIEPEPFEAEPSDENEAKWRREISGEKFQGD
jgi:hypothetical protein